MSSFKIGVRDATGQYRPGEDIAGAVQWTLDKPFSTVEMRLLWHTHGRGNPDVCVVDTVRFDAPLPQDTRSFCFTAPEAPYSFSTTYISLDWVLELVALPSKENDRLTISISPSGKPVLVPPRPPGV